MMRRLFIALPLPEAVHDVLLDTMEGLSGARWVDAESLHLTLRFVGEVDRHQARDLETALKGVHFAPFALQVAGVGHFEAKGRAKAIWAGVQPSGALDELQMRVELACRRAGLLPETRRFTPHVTLARLNSGSAPIGDWLARHGALRSDPWQVEGFVLFESDLTPNGPVYSQLRRFTAGPA